MSDPSLLQGGHRVAKRRSLGQSSVPAKLTEPSALPVTPAVPDYAAASVVVTAAPTAVDPVTAPAAKSANKSSSPRGVVSSEPLMRVSQAIRQLEKKAVASPPSISIKSKKSVAVASVPKHSVAPKEPTLHGRVPTAERLSAVTVSDTTASPHADDNDVDDMVSVDSLVMRTHPKGPSSMGTVATLEGRGEQPSTALLQPAAAVGSVQDDSVVELEEVLPIGSLGDKQSPSALFPLAAHVSSFAPTNLEISNVTTVDGHQHTHIDTDDDEGDEPEKADTSVDIVGTSVESGPALPQAASVPIVASAEASPNYNEEPATAVLLSSQVISPPKSNRDDRELSDHHCHGHSKNKAGQIDEKWFEERRHEHPVASTFAPHTPLLGCVTETGESHRQSPRRGFSTDEQRRDFAQSNVESSPEVKSRILSEEQDVIPPAGLHSASKMDQAEFEDEGGVPEDALESSQSCSDDGAVPHQPGNAERSNSKSVSASRPRFSGGVDPAMLVVDTDEGNPITIASLATSVEGLNDLPRALVAVDRPASAGLAAVDSHGGAHRAFQPSPDFVREVGLRFNTVSRVIRPAHQNPEADDDKDDDDDDDDEDNSRAFVPLAKVKVIAQPKAHDDLTVPPVILETPKTATAATVVSRPMESDVDSEWRDSLRPTTRQQQKSSSSSVTSGSRFVGASSSKPPVAGKVASSLGLVVVPSSPIPSSSCRLIEAAAEKTSIDLHQLSAPTATQIPVVVDPSQGVDHSAQVRLARRDVSPDGRKFAVSHSSLQFYQPAMQDTWIVTHDEEPVQHVSDVPSFAPAQFSMRKKLISPAVEIAPSPSPDPLLGSFIPASASTDNELKLRRMRNMQNALATIDARYGAKMKEIQQPYRQPLDDRAQQEVGGGGAAMRTGHRAVDQFAQGLELMLRELKRTPAASQQHYTSDGRSDVVEPHSFKLAR